jgi:hypothetical protein
MRNGEETIVKLRLGVMLGWGSPCGDLKARTSAAKAVIQKRLLRHG